MSAVPQKQTSPPPADAGAWISAAKLGLSERSIRRLKKQLRRYGAVCEINGEVHFQRNHPDICARMREAQRDRSYEDLSAYTARQIEEARRRLTIVRAGRQAIPARDREAQCGRTKATEWFVTVYLVAHPELGFPEGLPLRTYYRWERRANAAGEYPLRGLIDTRGRKEPGRGGQEAAEPTRSPEAWDYFRSLYLKPNKLKMATCYDVTAQFAKEKGWSWPSYRTICRAVDAEIPKPTIILAREGRKAYESTCAPRTRRDRSEVYAGDHWCADECELDFFARWVDASGAWVRGRPVLTAWLDERSRLFVGWIISDRANSDTILGAFKMGVGQYGPPRKITCDNGKDYKAAAEVKTKEGRAWREEFDQERLAGVYADLGIEVNWCIPYRPQSKIIESHFRTVHERFDKPLFDSYCGNTPFTRPDGANKIPLADLPTLDEIRAKFAEWLEVHHNTPSSATDMLGLAPAAAFVNFRSPSPREVIDGARLDFLCAKFVGPRRVTKDGVRHNGITYGQGLDQLLLLQGRKVWLRVDPDQADHVWVCDLETRMPIVKATNQRLAGATQADVRDGERTRARARRLHRQAMEAAPALLDTSTDAILKAMARKAKAERQPVDAPSPVSISAVRPDIAAALAAKAKPAAGPATKIDFARFAAAKAAAESDQAHAAASGAPEDEGDGTKAKGLAAFARRFRHDAAAG